MKIKEFTLDCLFPQRCLICDLVAEMGHRICKECLATEVFSDSENLCEICSKQEGSCICTKKEFSFLRCIAPFPYNEKMTEMVLCLKNQPKSDVIKDLAKEMERVILEKYANITFDYITYVPMDKKKEKEKGHNQAQSLCEVLAKGLNITILEPPIVKLDTGVSQHELSKAMREKNAQEAFIQDKNAVISGRVLIVDDIATTLATLNVCSTILKQLGATEIFCVTACTTGINS